MKHISINGSTETNLMNITDWEFEDAVYLENGTILFALSDNLVLLAIECPFSAVTMILRHL